MGRALWIFALLSFAPSLAAATGPAHLIVDLNPGVAAFDPDVSANAAFGGYTAVNGRVIFLAYFPKGAAGFYQFQCGLWVTDGTPGSAEALADLCGEEENPQHFIRILGSNGSLAFFTDAGDRLWRTDGTAAGTFPVARVVVSGLPAFAPDGRLFFTGCPPGTAACHLWTSDGTPQGTGPVGEAPPAAGTYGIFPSYAFAGPLALYAAGDALWASNGTRQGTFQLARVPAPNGIFDLVVQGGRAYFAAFNGARVDLWTADPVTRKVRKLRSFAFDSEDGGFALFPVGSRLLIVSSDGRATALWETDGTRAGTRQLGPPLAYNGFIDSIFDVGGRAVFAAPRGRSANPRIWSLEPGAKRPLPLPGPADLSNARIFAGRLYYLVRDGDGYELRVTDGTAAGTRVLKHLCLQGCEVTTVGLQEALGRLVIATPDGTLWETDGTAAGTLPFARRPPQYYPQQDFLVATANGRAIFTGFDPANGSQPWSSDLTPGHSGPIENVGGNLAAGARISVLSSVGSKALFPACDGVTEGIFVSDGTEAGTAPLPGTAQPCGEPPSPFAFFYRVGGLTWFSWKEQIWRTDGTAAGTVSLLDLAPSYPWLYSAAPLGGRLFFYPVPAQPTQGPFVFWTSDGTPAGTQAAFSLSTGPTGPFTAAGDLVFFEAGRTSPPFGIDLWRTDGTEAGTRPLLQIVPEILNETPPVVWTGSRYVFLAAGVQRGGEELELWVSDGTAAGTAPVIADPAAPRPFKPLGLVAFQGAAYFFAGGDSEHPSALWRTDGTATGTFPFKTINRPSNSQSADGFLFPELTPVGNQLFFRANDGVHGSEIWKTDGTAAGTVLVRDIAPGAAHASPEWLTAAGGKLYFAAFDPEHGYELWESDGTEAGTRLVQDIAPGPVPSNPQLLTPAEGSLYFTATDGVHGREPWVLPLSP